MILKIIVGFIVIYVVYWIGHTVGYNDCEKEVLKRNWSKKGNKQKSYKGPRYSHLKAD